MAQKATFSYLRRPLAETAVHPTARQETCEKTLLVLAAFPMFVPSLSW